MPSAVALLDAIEQHQLTVEFQGVFPVDDAQPAAFEALVRWDHPFHGRLAPSAFLPAEMGTGIGWAISTNVLDEALGQCSRWQRAGRAVGVAVNMSPGRLADQLLPVLIEGMLERHAVPAELLTIEVTEQRCLADIGEMAVALARLRELGVRTSLDDFGTGEANLARVRQLELDELKIDGSFVRDVAWSPIDRTIVASITDLAHRLGCVVVAEGVETQACLDVLLELGVDRAQGFHLHRPSSAAAVACDFYAAARRA